MRLRLGLCVVQALLTLGQLRLDLVEVGLALLQLVGRSDRLLLGIVTSRHGQVMLLDRDVLADLLDPLGRLIELGGDTAVVVGRGCVVRLLGAWLGRRDIVSGAGLRRRRHGRFAVLVAGRCHGRRCRPEHPDVHGRHGTGAYDARWEHAEGDAVDDGHHVAAGVAQRP